VERLKDKVAFITGAGSGIGSSTAILFAREGAKVAIADIDQTGGENTVKMICESGGEAVFVKTDVTREDSVKSAIKETVKRFGQLHIIDNNAGGSWPVDGKIHEGTLDIWQKTISFNLFSAMYCCKHGIPELIKTGGGAVILAGSQAGIRGWKRPAYSAAKGGIIALTRVLAVDYARNNVRVNCVCPGLVLTERINREYEKDPMFAEDMRPLCLLGFSEPLDLSYAKLYLASDEARGVTGAIFCIDSGYTAVGRIDPADILKK
jgi:NAD(P)-dependent dehydrogenase (short-subunit alcohol dehydrogenase family)